MSKPIIAVDIDDVLLEGVPAIVADYNHRFGTQLDTAAFYAETYDRQLWGDVDDTTAIKRVDQFAQSPAFIDREPVQEVARSLRMLAESYELHILTGRSEIVTELTNDWLRSYFPGIFSSVNFSNLYNLEKKRSKGEMCVEMGASFLIDDHPANVRSAAEHGLRAVLYGDYPWNRADMLPPGITRAKDWSGVVEYFNGAS